MDQRLDQPTLPSDKLRQEVVLGHHPVGCSVFSILVSVAMASTLVLLPFASAVQNMSIYFRARKVGATVKADAEQRFRAFIGKEPDLMDVSTGAYGDNVRVVSGTGIALAAGRLYVMDGGVAAEIPWVLIRTWNWTIKGCASDEGSVAHTPDETPMVMVNENARGRITAHRSSGFTIVTRDIQKSEWRFNTIDEKLCVKWMEVLNQMNEGTMTQR